MGETTAHIDFIAASYAAAVIVIGALVTWVTVDYRSQRQILADLEAQGVTRRSEPERGEKPIEPAKTASPEQAREQA